MGENGFKLELSSLHNQGGISTFRSTECECDGIHMYQSVAALLHFVETFTSISIGFEHFNHL